MTSDRKAESTDPRKTNENVTINDLPTPDATAAKVKGGIGPIDGKTLTKPFGPIDG